jgi:hypothetical protein
VWNAADATPYAQIAVYVNFGAGTSAGVVMLETAADADNGPWVLVTGGTFTWASASSVQYARFDGPFYAVRARISTAIVGGTVTVTLVGNS